MIEFAFPFAFSALVLPFVFRYVLPSLKGLHGDALNVPFLSDLRRISLQSSGLWSSAGTAVPNHLRLWGLWSIFLLLTLAAARPQFVGEPIPQRQFSRDIMLVTDISNSMLEPDFALGRKPITRLTAVKKTASDFLDKRPDDRFGLILFGTNAYLQAPLTYDKQSVKDILWSMDAGMAGNSTSIGDAIGLALKNLQKNKDDEKILILLTDGENNDGSLSMPEAIQLAKDENVKIYTIGVGSETAFIDSFFGMKINLSNQALDEKSLKKLAEETQGQYFRAKDTASLQQIYNAIDKLEPNQSNQNMLAEKKELFFWPLLAAFILACLMLSGKQK